MSCRQGHGPDPLAGLIIGARLGEAIHATDNRRLFSFALHTRDRALLEKAFAATRPIPGDCGDEYRRPPFLTASGDFSHHLSEVAKPFQRLPAGPSAERVLTGSSWEDIAGYCRAQRIGDRILVSGTTAIADLSRAVAPGDGGADHLYSRPYRCFRRVSGWRSRAHGRVLRDIKPANALVRVAGLIGDHPVEIEAEAIVRPAAWLRLLVGDAK
jgi:hypothetical protein